MQNQEAARLSPCKAGFAGMLGIVAVLLSTQACAASTDRNASLIGTPVTSPLKPVATAPTPVVAVAPAALPTSQAAAYAPLSVFRDKLSDGSLGPEMVVIPAGEFDMGSNDYDHTKPVHKVRIGKAFALGKTEVTRKQWRQVMGAEARKDDCDECPKNGVTWEKAQEYVLKLSQLTGKSYRLPSEAEWEYACRAGEQHKHCGSDDPNAVAWHSDSAPWDEVIQHPVAQKQKNAWGLYDMSGNVSEWVQDCHHNNYESAPIDGSAWVGKCDVEESAADSHILRGGSWYDFPQITSTGRSSLKLVGGDIKLMFINVHAKDYGLRVARSLP